MPSVQDSAYPRLKHNVSDKELATIYMLTPDEIALAERTTREDSTKLGFLGVKVAKIR